MRLLVLDTNVIVSAGIRPESAPAKLVIEWVLEGLVQTVTCPWIVEEYREVARRAKFRRYGFPPMWLEFLIEESLHLPDPQWSGVQVPDVKDIPFIALAETAGAWLVTANLWHFPAAARKNVTVLSPAEYLKHLSDEA
jgi:uncharacterized protein